jgi:hypothetical protein
MSSSLLHLRMVVTRGAVKGAPEQGAFILTLDSSQCHHRRLMQMESN